MYIELDLDGVMREWMEELETSSKEEKEMSVENGYGIQIDFDVAVGYMDDELREQIHDDMAPCNEQAFFDEYAHRHENKFGEVWELDTKNPNF